MNYLKLSAISQVILILMASNEKSTAQEEEGNVGLKIAGYQMIVSDNINSNKEKILEGMRKAAGDGADFFITPEGSLSGYTSNFDQEMVGNALSEIESEAKKLNIGLMLGTCYKEVVEKTEYCYNQVRLYDPDGKFMGVYNKILRCSPLDLPGTGEMVDYVEGELKTFEWKGHSFGVLICNDLWATPGYTTIPNPYLPWKLKQMGAEFILHCINSGTNQRYRQFHESSAELWAYSLGIPILEVNASGNSQPVNARSGLINGKGERISEISDTGEHLFITVIKL